MNTEGTSKRQELIDGLRALADFYEAHPDVPMPPYPEFTHCVLTDNDIDGQAEVVAVAEGLQVPVKFNAGSADVRTRFAGLEFKAFYVSRQRSERYQEDLEIVRKARGGVS